jgi:hypothetical protein
LQQKKFKVNRKTRWKMAFHRGKRPDFPMPQASLSVGLQQLGSAYSSVYRFARIHSSSLKSESKPAKPLKPSTGLSHVKIEHFCAQKRSIRAADKKLRWQSNFH